jgi:Ca2+-binding EF-hand superfamily protein/endonuclease/exonuclease/phosphatase family metal-dependent hydrolase
MSKRTWSHRHSLIRERLLHSAADIICIQEADGDTFDKDFGFMEEAGYGHVLHKKFRFRCATFYKADKFALENVGHKDRSLVTSLRSIDKDDRIVNVANCHLSGGAAPERRLRQVHDTLEQIRKWKDAALLTLEKQRKANRPSPKNIAKAEELFRCHQEAGAIVCGDFNSDGNTAVRRLLVEGSVDPEWREGQYAAVPLTSKRREQVHAFVDAAELAYASNVCDGDYGEVHGADGCRPATYVVPNLASLLLSTIDGEDIPRTEFGHQVAKGLANTLSLEVFCENEIEQAFESVDLDGNGIIDEDEVQHLLESVYVVIYGKKIEAEKCKFFSGFKNSTAGLSREQFADKLLALQQQFEQEESSSGNHGDIELTRGLIDTLGMQSYCETELETAFRAIDLDGSNSIDEDEIEALLQSVYLATYEKQIEGEKEKFFGRFHVNAATTSYRGGLSLEQFTERLLALQQELEGGSEGSELVKIKTEADAERMIGRFSPILRDALDYVFDEFCTSDDDCDILSEEDVAKFLIKVNGQLGRGGMWLYTTAMFEKKKNASMPVILTRQDWYGAFARELGEGKWWQVVYDLETCGADLRSKVERDTLHYQGWLDYVYFDSQRLSCAAVQEALTAQELSHIHDKGDALPNEWHPSDHLPVATVLSWRS